MARFSLTTALSMLDVPMPKDDDMSDDDFDGYLSDGSDIGQDDTPENSSGEAATAQAVETHS